MTTDFFLTMQKVQGTYEARSISLFSKRVWFLILTNVIIQLIKKYK